MCRECAHSRQDVVDHRCSAMRPRKRVQRLVPPRSPDVLRCHGRSAQPRCAPSVSAYKLTARTGLLIIPDSSNNATGGTDALVIDSSSVCRIFHSIRKCSR
jgi:hypothetical protein